MLNNTILFKARHTCGKNIKNGNNDKPKIQNNSNIW